MQSKTTKEQNKQFTYQDFYLFERGEKNKKVVLFLHGAGSNFGMWSNHIDAMESGYNCLAPDLPGHGKSNHLSWTTIENIGDELVQLIKIKTNDKIILVGFSLGGSLSFYLLENYPDLIEKALIDGASAYPLKRSSFIVLTIRMISPFLNSDFLLNTMAKSLDIPKKEYPSFKESFKIADKNSFKKSMVQANRYKLINKDFTKSIPVLYASGEKESQTMHHSHIELSSFNKSSKCVQYPGKGHAWMIFDMETHVEMVKSWIGTNEIIPEKFIEPQYKIRS